MLVIIIDLHLHLFDEPRQCIEIDPKFAVAAPE
jgi:hypothetical protein